MRTILVLGFVGCTEQNYPSATGYAPAPPPDGIEAPTPAPALHVDRYEWAAGSCDPVRVPDASIVQLLDCQDATDGVTQCWPDAEQRLTLIDGVAHVLCPDDPLSPDWYRLTVISTG